MADLNKDRTNVHELNVTFCIGHGVLWRQRMPDYRAYFVGREDFIGYRGFACEDDAEAIEKAKEIFEGPTIELWCGPRLVTRIIDQKAK